MSSTLPFQSPTHLANYAIRAFGTACNVLSSRTSHFLPKRGGGGRRDGGVGGIKVGELHTASESCIKVLISAGCPNNFVFAFW